MKLLIAFAFIALVSAAPESQPIEDPAPSPVKVVDGPAPILIKDDSPLSTADAAVEISPVKVIDATLDSEVAEKISPVKVVDQVSPVRDMWREPAPLEEEQVQAWPLHWKDVTPMHMRPAVPVISPEILYQDVRNLIDISPAFVSKDVMQEASMADPLENVDRVNVVDGPVDELNKMEPVAPIEDLQVPVQGIVPRDMWREPAPLEEEQVQAQWPLHWKDVPLMHMRPAYYRDNILR